MLTLTGCAGSLGSPSTPEVNIPPDCEELAVRVPTPRFQPGTSAKIALARTTVALGKANNNLDATRECQANQRLRFAGQK